MTVLWRYLESDSINVAFNVYQANPGVTDSSAFIRLNETPIADVCQFQTKAPSLPKYYVDLFVRPVYSDGREGPWSIPFRYKGKNYLEIPMVQIDGDTGWTYSPSDASVGDLNGDGEYEIVIKREPNNGKDNSQDGVTGVTYLDAYKIDGTFLWRINLGPNIRSGAHYTQFMVYDLDNDGIAEVVCKTADGTIDGKGTRIGTDKKYVGSDGYILSGPEYLTIFDGRTGRALKTVNYNPPRLTSGTSSNSSLLNSIWGDNYGNRCDRYLAAVAYLDGEHPSLVMCRGYYTGKSGNMGRTTLWALDWRDSTLTQRWFFDTYQHSELNAYCGQGFHNLRVGDIDGDGKDEIVYGACTIDDNGKPYHSTQWGHGDAMHMSDIDPELPGLEIWTCHEDKKHGSRLRRAADDTEIFGIDSGDDVGRCMMADIDPNTRGCEMWSSRSGGIRSAKGAIVSSSTSGVSMNMACWWDGRLNRNLLDGTSITRWNLSGTETLLRAEKCASNNGTKSNPCLQADILGDWREEVIWRTSDNKNIRIYVSSDVTKYRFHSFMQEPVYRISVATQNVAYNQPTQPGFYMGSDLEDIFQRSEYEVKGDVFELTPCFEHASAFRWSNGDTTRTLHLDASTLGYGQTQCIRLQMTYRGFVFEDSMHVSFVETALPQIDWAGTAVWMNQGRIHYHFGSGLSGQVSMHVYHMDGRICLSQLLDSGEGSVSAEELSSGLYLVEMRKGSSNRFYKVLR